MKIDAQTGLPVPEGQDGLAEYFYQESIPVAQASGGLGGGTGAKPAEEVKDQIF